MVLLQWGTTETVLLVIAVIIIVVLIVLMSTKKPGPEIGTTGAPPGDGLEPPDELEAEEDESVGSEVEGPDVGREEEP
jgi:hypothetical protein